MVSSALGVAGFVAWTVHSGTGAQAKIAKGGVMRDIRVEMGRWQIDRARPAA